MEATRSQVLTGRQADELHKAVISYLSANGLSQAADALRTELDCGGAAYDEGALRKYEMLLEKKWAVVVRLEKKILELEAHGLKLQREVDSLQTSTVSEREPLTWLPSPPARHTLESHQSTVNCLAFHPIFTTIASGSEDRTIKIWDWEFGELERTIKGHTEAVKAVDFGGPRSRVLLASCSTDSTIKLWDPANDYKNIRTLQGHEHSISAVRFVPSGNLLVSASGDSTIKVWDSNTGFCVKTLTAHTGWVRDVYPSSDGHFLVSAGNDRTVRLWNLMTSENTHTLSGHEHVIQCCAFAPSSSYPYLAKWAGLKTKPSPSSTVEYMATGSRDKTIKLWDLSGRCFATLHGHDNWVSAILFHPGGRYLLSVADDKTLRYWDLTNRGECVMVHRGLHPQFITCMRWALRADDYNKVGSGSLDPQNGEVTPVPQQIRCVIATGSMDATVKIFSQ
ncbi:Nuclear distribution protein PAC1 [Hirsutella minnesotensis 3608]|uniref:Nuclear distribution protein PAC1 n=1 Tax=Hirsutella minnesotensis 3608 TaxID=1043627 RepID=A0A0F7ZFJ2_9HYPO|nr:Nuclear distribution protein PAC1 [Hirsutella minnesotensis 3608]